MTTDPDRTRPRGTAPRVGSAAWSPVRAAASATLAAGLGTVIVAALAAGSAAAGGAGVATGIVLTSFTFGAVVLTVATRIAPAASLLVALLTYTLTIVLIGIVFLALSRSGALNQPLDATWLGGTVIGCTLVWVTAQIISSTRTRQPVYDLPSDRSEASAR